MSPKLKDSLCCTIGSLSVDTSQVKLEGGGGGGLGMLSLSSQWVQDKWWGPRGQIP